MGARVAILPHETGFLQSTSLLLRCIPGRYRINRFVRDLPGGWESFNPDPGIVLHKPRVTAQPGVSQVVEILTPS